MEEVAKEVTTAMEVEIGEIDAGNDRVIHQLRRGCTNYAQKCLFRLLEMDDERVSIKLSSSANLASQAAAIAFSDLDQYLHLKHANVIRRILQLHVAWLRTTSLSMFNKIQAMNKDGFSRRR